MNGFRTHGMSRTSEYRIWIYMIRRCTNPAVKDYDRYGARGIKVCDRWMEFENFVEDMGLRPSKSHTLDRISNDGPYSPGNCKWSTKKEQARNRAARSDNTSGHMGIRYRRNKWTARIVVDKKEIKLGTFDILEEAIQARREGELKYWKSS